MPSLLSNPLTRRLLRPAVSLVEQRMEHVTHAFQKDLDALHHELADLRRRSYGLGLLLDHTGRDAHRMPTPEQVGRLVAELGTLTGAADERARGDVTVAYRHLVALEALGAGGIGGSVSDVCGRLAAVPRLVGAARGGVVEVLETGARHGLFAAALRRMLRRQGVEARLTLVGALDEDAVRDNLALGGAGSGEARLVRGGPDGTEVRDRRYGVLLLDAPYEGVLGLAAPDALLVTPPAASAGLGLRPLGRVADSAYHSAAA
ncbi:class I SAM-dependent methyltransferase [Streptomyces fradiae]|uniref:class I SAM-dependent methyltransferase n=1 Tax=Streptomyces fradiae TaxID=1906 RepID=UPI0035BE52C3